MKNLLLKEFRLATHPTNFIFLSLSALLLIPGYPYYIVFFYTMLGVFFLCLAGRENRDVEYSLSLPVRKRAIVKARVAYAALIEIMQVLVTIPFVLIRRGITPAENAVGMDANVAFFGLSLLMLGLFNVIFFIGYYKNPSKVGKPLIVGSTVAFLYIVLVEGCTYVVPFFRDVLDTPDPQFLPAKLAVLGAGLAAFTALTLAAFRISAARFEVLDL
jgi:hypothetical protein